MVAHLGCPICQNTAGGRCTERPSGRDSTIFNCDVCGEFELSRTAEVTLERGGWDLSTVQRAAISHRIWLSSADKKIPVVTTDWIKGVVESGARLPSPDVLVTNTLCFVGDEVKRIGRNLDSLPLHFYAVIGAPSPDFAHQIASELVDEGLLTGCDTSTDDGPGMINVGMKLRGWKRYEAERGRKASAEWVRAAEAVAMLEPILTEHLARLRICERAHAGLIRARAEHFHTGERRLQDHEIPKEFWWAEGHEALDQDWAAGDFSTWLDSRMPLKAFGVTFARADIQKILPSVKTGKAASGGEGKRRLTTIVALDVAGYSARTEVDEPTATAEIAALRPVIEAVALSHDGRIFNSAGDGFMLEFASSLAAVEAAIELARKCEPRVRVGVHLGDVVVQPNGDLLGHGVNVAARLMGHAEPG